MKVFTLPDLGEGLQEAEIVSWHVKPGEEIQADQPLLSVETAKAVVEIPAPYTGRVAKLFGQASDVIQVGSPLCAFEGEAQDAGTVVGAVQSGHEVVKEANSATPGQAALIKATPAVRALAHRLDVDLGIVTPTGPDNIITSTDVQRAAKVLGEAGPPEALRGVRKAMAQNMALAHREVVPATIMDDADIEAWPKGTDITIRLIRALAAGCRAEPALNTWFDGPALARRLMKNIDVGIAVDTPDGLFVPVLRDVGNRSEEDLRRGLDRMKEDVRNRKIPPEELRGNTITLSNFGTIAGRYAAPVVLPPTVAIVGAGKVVQRVVVVDGQPAVRKTLPISITFDHRSVTGGEAGRFLGAMLADLAQAG